ncbi:opine dehydrogenase [Breznakia sp. PF5-3]|uniref:NAD/NADP octopine/nopaline dehydrogenase family protein n=1 Tax=unclassified Breznakia TaxID=2623764 RepID=UPI0024062C93|nr:MULTISPECIES: NAD/NADP-dependent octopine/nopaline dehydrogenase family protein [unclassified Breznakia]MDF9824941.1 opine dehydrogenase [Breznakia sp. PM6-1]MDF9835791.1 opine dehydrogenase [Breznakia sp. PF5-3]MDF9837915.1 opine dehydrogenase [Breznakia sp. PFB2-8]MDF9859904.1 opine dehydrogenase [Breznakia sp. PH5-24]
MKTKIAVLGGGNGGHAAAADLSMKGFEVHMYEDERFAKNMKKVFDTKTIKIKGACGEGDVEIAMVTSNLEEAIKDVEFILVAVPAFAHNVYAEKLKRLVKPGQIVFVLPGTFGSLLFWKAFQEQGITGVQVAETHTLPYATRLITQGESLVMSRFNPLKVGVIPANKTTEVVNRLSVLFDGLEPIESVIACGLSSLNPIIHVPGCILNAGRIEIAKGEFYFYTEGFSDCVVRATEAIDKERISLLDSFGYKSDIAAHGVGGTIKTDSIKEAIASDPNFAKIKGPADLKNRYYSEDIPFGLASWAKIAHQYNIQTPIMDSMINLGSVILEQDCWTSGRSLEELGIQGMDKDTLKAYLVEGK